MVPALSGRSNLPDRTFKNCISLQSPSWSLDSDEIVFITWILAKTHCAMCIVNWKHFRSMGNNEHLSQLENAFFTHFSKADKKSSYKVAKTEYLATLGEGLHITGKRPKHWKLGIVFPGFVYTHLPCTGSFKEHGKVLTQGTMWTK